MTNEQASEFEFGAFSAIIIMISFHFSSPQGNRVSTVSDTFTVIIGGNNDDDQTDSENGSKVTVASGSGAKKQQRKRAKQTIANNRIKSTKYTILSFLPKNLLEQFRRIANFYFLVMTIIAIVIGKQNS